MRAILASVMLMAVSACQLQPLYGGGSSGAAAQALSSIAVPLIPDKSGFLVRQALLERVGGGEAAQYRLDVELDDEITGLGIRGDDSITRERRTLRARWQLVDIAADRVLIDATSRSDASVDVVSSEYAVVAAEQDALERLATELANDIAARIALARVEQLGE